MQRTSNNQSGVALIIVLGTLSVLVLMAVSFIITMRIERLSANNYVDAVRAKYLINVALGQAIKDVSDDLKANNLYYPNFGNNPNVFESLVTSGDTHAGPEDLLIGQAAKYLPANLLTEAKSLLNGNGYEFIDIIDSHVNPNKVIGRYAYLIVNCSGRLNANAIGNATNEFPQSKLSGITFDTNILSGWVRFESFPELDVSRVSPNKNDLFVYSRFPEDKYVKPDGTIADKIDISSTNSIQTNEVAIKAAFAAAGLDGEILYNCLLDYVDADNYPQDPVGPCMERVPMFSEIALKSTLTENNSTNYSQIIQLSFEFDCPSFTKGSGPFKVEPGFVTNITFSDSQGKLTVNQPTWNTQTITFPAESPTVLTLTYPEVEVALTNQGRFYVLTADIKPFKITSNFKTVDTWNGTLSLSARVKFNELTKQESLVCSDPRVNGAVHDWIPAMEPSLGTNNNQASHLEDDIEKTGYKFYVRNGPLDKISELGMLNIGDSWRSVRLTSVSGTIHPVLDMFKIDPAPFTRNKININTPNNNLLKSVFKNIVVEDYPGDPAATLLNETIVDKLVDQLNTINYSGNSTIQTLANLDEYSVMATNTEREIESIIGGAAKYFGVQQNIFTIFVVAQSIQDQEPFGSIENLATEVRAESRALAVVWRDPITNKSFIRQFKWIDE